MSVSYDIILIRLKKTIFMFSKLGATPGFNRDRDADVGRSKRSLN